MQRFGKVIGLRTERVDEYLEMHREVWPEVYAQQIRCHLQNFTIFHQQLPDGKHYLFMYLEYVGSDYTADMKKMAQDPTTQKWWRLTEPCQERLPGTPEGEWWQEMTEVCHHD